MTNLGVLIEIRDTIDEALLCCCCYLWGPQFYVLAGRNLPGVVDVFAFSVAGVEPRGLPPMEGLPTLIGLLLGRQARCPLVGCRCRRTGEAIDRRRPQDGQKQEYY